MNEVKRDTRSLSDHQRSRSVSSFSQRYRIITEECDTRSKSKGGVRQEQKILENDSVYVFSLVSHFTAVFVCVHVCIYVYVCIYLCLSYVCMYAYVCV